MSSSLSLLKNLSKAYVPKSRIHSPKWIGTGDLAPVVIDSEKSCSGDKDDVFDEWIRNWLVGSKNVQKFKACYKGRRYHLVSAPGTKAEDST